LNNIRSVLTTSLFGENVKQEQRIYCGYDGYVSVSNMADMNHDVWPSV